MNRPRETKSDNIKEGVEHGKDTGASAEGVFENLARSLFGSCGNVVEAASFLVQRGCSRTTYPSNENVRERNRQSIDPLLRLAGRYQSKCLNPRDNDSEVPSFLGDSVNYSFDENVTFDDNISALSAHTLEEMAKNGPMLMPHRARVGEDSPFYNPPSPARTDSSSSSSREQGFRWSDPRKKSEPRKTRPFEDRKMRSTTGVWRREHPSSNTAEKLSIINVAKAGRL